MQHSASPDTGFQRLPLSDPMAAEMIGLDLSKPFDEPTREAVHRAFLRYQLLAFRDQSLTKEQQIAFTEQFGALERHTLRNKGTNENPQVHIVTNLDGKGKPSGTVKSARWHSDKSFRPEPSMATILHAVTLPPEGGDTCFADMYAAYDALPESEKAALNETPQTASSLATSLGISAATSWRLCLHLSATRRARCDQGSSPSEDRFSKFD